MFTGPPDKRQKAQSTIKRSMPQSWWSTNTDDKLEKTSKARSGRWWFCMLGFSFFLFHRLWPVWNSQGLHHSPSTRMSRQTSTTPPHYMVHGFKVNGGSLHQSWSMHISAMGAIDYVHDSTRCNIGYDEVDFLVVSYSILFFFWFWLTIFFRTLCRHCCFHSKTVKTVCF